MAMAMAMARGSPLLLAVLSFLMIVVASMAGNVTYDHRALVIDGRRRLLISACIHYPRSTPQMWPDLIAKAKDGGVDVIQTYVFWNMHEPVQGQYNFEGRLNLVGFIQEAHKAGLYVNLRIGPYVCAEWNYGGFPIWLHFIQGIKFRTDNEPFKNEMQKFTTKIVEMMKAEGLFYWQGGPIILAQIENEYGNVDAPYGAAGKSYVKWAAQMAVGQNTGVPWVMCQQSDAPDPIINTCNGFYCDGFSPNSALKPAIWTENWSGWFHSFGGLRPHRPVQDLAFAVARFYQRGGTFQSYYMYHGGTNFGRSSGGPFISTSYDYDAPLDEYGNIRQPKWGHLKELHQALKLCEAGLVQYDPKWVSLGSKQEAHVYTDGGETCVAFLANYDDKNDATVNYNHQSYALPAWSVSILPDCKNVVFNTAKVGTLTSSFVKKAGSFRNNSTQIVHQLDSNYFSTLSWSWYPEPIGVWGGNSFSKNELLEQINTTGDTTDYLWYTTSTQIQASTSANLSVKTLGHAMHIFVNGQLSGTAIGSSEYSFPVALKPGQNSISILSMTVGLQNYGSFFDTSPAGVNGPVKLKFANGAEDLSLQQWTYQIGLKGEYLSLQTESGAANSQWNSGNELPRNQPMTWYKTTFDAPLGDDPVALDLLAMKKGQAWVNGEGIGRYWPAYLSPKTGCPSSCDYRGAYSQSKCSTNCGQPSQRWYHIPRSWLKPSGNTLVLFEELGGNPTQISLDTSFVGSVCAHVSESHHPPLQKWREGKATEPQVTLDCGRGKILSSISFASYGNPHGVCGSFLKGSCHAVTSHDIVTKSCVGKQSCSMTMSFKSFGRDPCPNVMKSLAIEATCA